MKNQKFLSMILGVSILLGSQTAFGKEISVYIDGNPLTLSQPIIIENHITYVPMRAIGEALGADAYCENNHVGINLDGRLYADCEIGSKKATTRDGEVLLEGTARVTNQTTYVPLRFISEALGATVEYDLATGQINVSTAGIQNKLESIAKEEQAQREGSDKEWEAASKYRTQNDKYYAEGTYDVMSNQWIYEVTGKETSTYVILVYNIETGTWSLVSTEKAKGQSQYRQYISNSDIEYTNNYKNHTITEDFHYIYEEDLSSAYFSISFSEQNPESYFMGSEMFVKDFVNHKIEWLPKSQEEAVLENGQYSMQNHDNTLEVNEPEMPKLPSDLDIHKLPVIHMNLKTNYHAKITIGDKSKEIVVAFKKEHQDFVPLKEVQSLMSGIVFNQTADGIRQLSYNGKTVEMDKDQYKILLSSNRMMISTQVLEGLGIKIVVEYI